MTLEIIGWVNGLGCLSLAIIGVIFESWTFVNYRKNKSKILLYYGLALLSSTLWGLGYWTDFLYILVTGQNLDPFLFLILTLATVPLYLVFILLFYVKIHGYKGKIVIIETLIAAVLYGFFIFLKPLSSITIQYPSVPGSDLLNFTYIYFSPLGIIVIIQAFVLYSFCFQLLYKSFKLKGRLKDKYQYISFGGIIFGLGIIIQIYTTLPLFITIVIWIISIPFSYYGVIPSKPKTIKKKEVPKEIIKFASFVTGKKNTVNLENERIFKNEIYGTEFLIFMSYATKDADTFKVDYVAEKLKSYSGIKEMFYYQGEKYDNFIKYMNDNLGDCNGFLLFCSQNALNSTSVEKEWTAAEAMEIPIIPIFYDLKHVPPLLQPRVGVEFNFYNIDQTVKEIYSTIAKKCSH